MRYGTWTSTAVHDEAAAEQEPASLSTWRVIMKAQVLRGLLVFALFCAVLVSSGQHSEQVAFEELARVGTDKPMVTEVRGGVGHREKGSPDGHGKGFRVIRVTKGIGKRGYLSLVRTRGCQVCQLLSSLMHAYPVACFPVTTGSVYLQ